jgi:foldase protein PrsA
MKTKKSGGITLKNIRRLICSALITVFAMSAAGCSMVEKTPEAVNKTVLAKVGKVDITRATLDSKMEADVISGLKTTYGEDYRKNSEALAKYKESAPQYLDQVVTEEILRQKAKEFNLNPDLTKMDDEVQKEIDSIVTNYFGGDKKKFDTGIIELGYTLDSLKDQIKEQLTNQTDQIALSRAYQYLLKDVTVTDDEIKAFYDTNKDTYFTTGGGANLAHILVPTEDQAKEIRAKITAGASFADMAKQYGTDGTKDKGGDLGFYSYDTTELDADFMAGAKTLKEGEVSQPVKTQFGYHLIKATNINTEKSVKPLEEVKDQIKSSLLQDKQSTEFTTKLTELKKELNVKTYESKI